MLQMALLFWGVYMFVSSLVLVSFIVNTSKQYVNCVTGAALSGTEFLQVHGKTGRLWVTGDTQSLALQQPHNQPRESRRLGISAKTTSNDVANKN